MRCGLDDFTDTRLMLTSHQGSDIAENVCVEVTGAAIAGQEADVHKFDFGRLAGNLIAPPAGFDHLTRHIE